MKDSNRSQGARGETRKGFAMRDRSWRLVFAAVVIAAATGLVILVTSGSPRQGSQVSGPAEAPSETLGTQPSVPLLPAPGPDTIAIPASPSGASGSTTNPLGSPAAALASCPALSAAPSSITFSVSGAGFSEACYQIPANASIGASLVDSIVNPSTKLTVVLDVTISSVTNPVVAQQVTPTTSVQAPGLTYPTSAFPLVVPSNAIYTSATATDDQPVSFTIPPLPPGQYLLQVPAVPTIGAAILSVGGVMAASPTTTSSPAAPTTSTTLGSAAPSGVTILASTPANQARIESAFKAWEMLPLSCQAQVVPGSDRYATDGATGVTWAIAKFQPSPTCTNTQMYAGGPSQQVSPDQIGPFEGGYSPLGVFEESSGGWTMNEEGGSPFPCPALGGNLPGPGNAAVPPNILAAWGLPYASNCANVTYPPEPRG